MKKPLILVTNDDGIGAPGIRKLAELMNDLGEVWVIAPDSPQSAKSHAITVSDILTFKEHDYPGAQRDFSCSGTPVDCVKLGLDKILDRKPDLVVSGINHGSNASINVFYSGTMGAAIEAGLEGIPAIGFSLCDFSLNANFEPAGSYVQEIAQLVLEKGMPRGTVLNVNIPKCEEGEISGIRFARMASAKWEESYEERKNPHGRTYYWLAGTFQNKDSRPDADENLLAENYITVVPLKLDFTNETYLHEMKEAFEVKAKHL